MRFRFTLGLTSSSESKTKTRNVFRVTLEYCYLIWKARNNVLFWHKVLSADTVDRISHVLKSECDRLYADIIYFPAENWNKIIMPAKFHCPLARCGFSIFFCLFMSFFVVLRLGEKRACEGGLAPSIWSSMSCGEQWSLVTSWSDFCNDPKGSLIT